MLNAFIVSVQCLPIVYFHGLMGFLWRDYNGITAKPFKVFFELLQWSLEVVSVPVLFCYVRPVLGNDTEFMDTPVS